MKLLRICPTLALACVLAVPAIAQDVAPVIAPTNASSFLNIVLGAAAMLLTTILVPLAVLYGQGLLAERRLKNAQLQEQLRATLDSATQKAIGGALGNIAIPDGKLSGPAKAGVVDEASKALAKNFPETFAALGVENVAAKSVEMVKSRLGMMDAQAAGNAIPNPSAPISEPATQTVNVAKK